MVMYKRCASLVSLNLCATRGKNFLPGEYEPQAKIMISDKLCTQYPDTYVLLASAIIQGNAVLTICSSTGLLPSDCDLGGDFRSQIEVTHVDTETVWIRDYGPFITITENHTLGKVLDFHYPRGFNTRRTDDAHPGNIMRWWCSTFGLYCGSYFGDMFRHVLLEGGNLLSSGDGLCLVSDAILCQTGTAVNCRENEPDYAMEIPFGKSLDWIRAMFAAELGCTDLRILQGYFGDESLNHVDMFMTFATARDLLFGTFDVNTDPRNNKIAKANEAMLQDLIVGANPLRIHHVPMPYQCRDLHTPCENDRHRTLRTFLNGLFLPTARSYLMPTYALGGDYRAQEAEAVSVFKGLGWDVVKMSGDELIQHNGVFHCVTRNFPSTSGRNNNLTTSTSTSIGNATSMTSKLSSTTDSLLITTTDVVNVASRALLAAELTVGLCMTCIVVTLQVFGA